MAPMCWLFYKGLAPNGALYNKRVRVYSILLA